MGQEGADADHLGLELLHEQHILHKCLRGLPGRSHHDAASGLIADVLQIP